MNQFSSHPELTAILIEMGYDSEDIAKILQKVAEYEANTLHDSVFDSIENGTFNLDSIITDALSQIREAE